MSFFLQNVATVETLNENGELRKLLKPYKVHTAFERLRHHSPTLFSFVLTEPGSDYHLSNVWRLSITTLQQLRRLQEIRSSKSPFLHKGNSCSQMYGMR